MKIKIVNLSYIKQLISSMEEGATKLMQAEKEGKDKEINPLKTLIFDLHEKIGEEIEKNDK